MNKNIFFIGPASVGKTTIGRLLAEEIEWAHIDVDKEFCEQIALIPDYIQKYSYAGYAEANSQLVDRLIEVHPEKTVFSTPSGYLVHEDSSHLIEKHLDLIRRGVSILLLPSENPQVGVEVVVRRQLDRWNDTFADKERTRFLSRFEKYKNYGDIKIFSMAEPELVVKTIIKKLEGFI